MHCSVHSDLLFMNDYNKYYSALVVHLLHNLYFAFLYIMKA